VQSGAALLLGGMLLTAGALKAVAPWYVASALRRVIRSGSDRALRLAGRLLGAWELALGAALLGTGGPDGVIVAALAVPTFAGFVGFVVLAIRRGAACGCWASLSEGPAGGAELGRAVFLAALAVDLFLLRHKSTYGGVGVPPSAPYVDVWRIDGHIAGLAHAAGWTSVAWACGLLGGAYLATRIGAALLPVPTPRLRRQLRMQAAPGMPGRVVEQLALLGGFVHAGTPGGRRRYLAAGQAAAASGDDVTSSYGGNGTSSPNVHRSRMALPPRPPVEVPAAPEGTAR